MDDDDADDDDVTMYWINLLSLHVSSISPSPISNIGSTSAPFFLPSLSLSFFSIFLLFAGASFSSSSLSLSLLLSMSLSPAAQRWSCSVTGILIPPLSSALTPSPLVGATL